MNTAILVLARTLHIGSAMMLVTLPFFAAVILQPARQDRFGCDGPFCGRLIRLLWIAWIMQLLSGAAWLWLVTAAMSNDSPWGGISLRDLQTVLLQTNFGQLWIGRGIGALLLGALLVWLGKQNSLHRRTIRPAEAGFLIGAVALLASLAWAGHAGAGARWHAWHLTVDVVHLEAGAVWPLGLFPLALFLRKSLRESGGFTATDSAVVLRFSRASLAAVLVLISSGVANSWLMLPSWISLVDSIYGRLLLGKTLVVAIMIGLGAFNRFGLLTTFPEGAPRLVRTVMAESLLALIVLLIVGLMGITPPPIPS